MTLREGPRELIKGLVSSSGAGEVIEVEVQFDVPGGIDVEAKRTSRSSRFARTICTVISTSWVSTES